MPSTKRGNSPKKQKRNKLDEFVDIMFDPVRFFTFISGFIPTEYQKQILRDESQFVTIRASRQSGKSEVIALKVLHKCLLNSGFKVLVLAPTKRQSGIIYGKIQAYLLKHEYINEKIIRMSAAYTLLDNGAEIYCLPGSNPITVRGYSPNMVIFDEAAYIKDDVFSALEPSMATTRGSIVMLSTPFGKQGRFYDSHTILDKYNRYHVPWTDCPFLDEEYIKEEMKNKTSNEIKQEYGGEFIEEADTYFPVSLIKSCIADIEPVRKPEPEWDYYLGVDPARFGTDEATYVVVRHQQIPADEKNPDPLDFVEMVYWEYSPKSPLTDVMGRVQAMNAVFNFRNIFIDGNGMGAGPADYLAEQNLPIEINPFGNKEKQEMYSNLKVLMERSQRNEGIVFQIPNHPKLIRQLSEMQYEYSSSGNFKIHHPDKANAHDDWPDALALACSFKVLSGGIFTTI